MADKEGRDEDDVGVVDLSAGEIAQSLTTVANPNSKKKASAPKLAHLSAKMHDKTTLSLKDLPEHLPPSNYNAHGYEAYTAVLTEKGRNSAAEICKPSIVVKNSICLACVDSGRPLKECLRADIPGKTGGNLSKHFAFHQSNGHIDEFGNRVMLRILELKDKTLGPSDKQVISTNAKGELTVASEVATKNELEAAVVRWLHDNGFPFTSVAMPSFRKVLEVAKRIRSKADFKLNPSSMKKQSSALLERERCSLAEKLATFNTPRCHVVFDGWEDMGKKYLGIAMAFIEVLPDKLKFRVEPIALKRLHVDFSTSTMQSDKQVTQSIKKVLFEVLKMPTGALASAKSDNAENNVSCMVLEYDASTASETNPGYMAFTQQYSNFYDDRDSRKLQGCISHSLALGAAYALGLKKTASPHPAMPAPPQKILDVLDRCRRQAIFLRTPKIVSTCELLVKNDSSGRLKMIKPCLENDTRWWTSSKMMESTIRNKWIVEELEQTDVALDLDDYIVLQEIHAILHPMADVSLSLSQLTSRPVGPATLPLIYFTLSRYGVDLEHGLFATELELSPDYLTTTFMVLQCDGSWKTRELSTFRPASQQFFCGFVRNLITRLHTQRGNKFFYEITGMMADPVWKEFAAYVFTQDPETEDGDANMWTHHSVLHQIHRSMKWLGDMNRPAEEPSIPSPPAPGPELTGSLPNKRIRLNVSTDGEDGVEQEYARFKADGVSILKQYCGPGASFGFEEFTRLISEYDPLEYWTATKRAQFPRIFNLNLATLPYLASSAFMERVFSCAKGVLHSTRSRLSDDNVENCVLLNVLAKCKDASWWEPEDNEEDEEEKYCV